MRRLVDVPSSTSIHAESLLMAVKRRRAKEKPGLAEGTLAIQRTVPVEIPVENQRAMLLRPESHHRRAGDGLAGALNSSDGSHTRWSRAVLFVKTMTVTRTVGSSEADFSSYQTRIRDAHTILGHPRLHRDTWPKYLTLWRQHFLCGGANR